MKDKLVSLVDKDAKHEAKSDSKPFTGYKASILKSDDGFVTNIIGTAGNTCDGNILLPLADEKTKNSSRPSKIRGDTHYGSAENRFQMSQRGITVVSQIQEGFNKTRDFKDDMRKRAHIEPKNAEMNRFHGMARARYWGLPKANIQFIITAIVVNVKRLANVIGSVSHLKACQENPFGGN